MRGGEGALTSFRPQYAPSGICLRNSGYSTRFRGFAYGIQATVRAFRRGLEIEEDEIEEHYRHYEEKGIDAVENAAVAGD